MTINFSIESDPFDSYGNIMGESETIQQPFKYVGQLGVFSEADGLYYMRARYYDAQIGRFISEDPIGFAGGINLYAYVGGNPVMLVDPSGLFGRGFFSPAPDRSQSNFNLDTPKGVNIQSNITAAQKMNATQFYNAVKAGGIFDYKTGGSQYENFGNYHFGIMAAAIGISVDDAVIGAGLYQFTTNTARYYFGFPYDDPVDSFFIRAGHQTGIEALTNNQSKLNTNK